MATRKPKAPAHPWAFRTRFRKGAFGWKSQPAVARVREAVAEIRKVARTEPVVAAEGAVLFLEKVSGALQNVDSSSGSIGSAVNAAVEELAALIGSAPAEPALREAWLERLWDAFLADEIPYIETLADHWGEVCGSAELAAAWAARLRPVLELALADGSFFRGEDAVFSSLLRAGAYEEIVRLIERKPRASWHSRQWGVKALVALGRKAEAIRYAEASREPWTPAVAVARTCEAILLSSGLVDEAWERYAIEAAGGSTHLATFRGLATKYPGKSAAEILDALAASTPGEEGKWFAAAKDAGLFDEAIRLANSSPCNPATLVRAARDFAEKEPAFALEAGIAAVRWLAAGYGYEVTGLDVLDAYQRAMLPAERLGRAEEATTRLREIVGQGDAFVRRFLGPRLGLS